MKTGTKAIGEWAWERKIEPFGMSQFAKSVELIRNVPRYRGQDIKGIRQRGIISNLHSTEII